MYLTFQDVPVQEQKGNLYPATLPHLRTAALMQALEAPRVHQPAAWHETLSPQPLARHTPLSKSFKQGRCFWLSWVMLPKQFFHLGPYLSSHLNARPLSLTHMKWMWSWSFLQWVGGSGWKDNRSLINGFWHSPPQPVCKAKHLDRKLKRAREKKIINWLPATGKTNHIPQELTGNSPHSFNELCLCDGSAIILRQEADQSKGWLWKKKSYFHIHTTKIWRA